MKISNVQFHSLIKKVAITAPVLFATQVAVAQKPTLTQDVFEKSENIENEILEEQGLISPEIFVAGETVYPAIVVDLSEKQLYKYDQDTYLEAVYPVAVGKPSTPTNTGLRRVIGVEDYPYLSAPKSTKRFNNPDDYGPKVITLEKISLSNNSSVILRLAVGAAAEPIRLAQTV